MRMLLATAAVLVILASSDAAQAGGWECAGKVTRHANGTLLIEQTSDQLDDCLVENKALVRRILKVCPVGSGCELFLGDAGRGYCLRPAHDGRLIVVTKPESIERLK
jgi:hypothetical protein